MTQWTTPQLLFFGMFLVLSSTSIGALPVLFIRDMSDKLKSLFLGLSAGIMLGATFFSLIMPALDLYEKNGQNSLESAVTVGFVMLLGAVLLFMVHQRLPHAHFYKKEDHDSRKWSQQMLVLFAVALHNFPEGVAVGVGMGSGQQDLGLTLSIAIALQDFPEGLIVALGLHTLGIGYKRIFFVTAMTGVIEAFGVPIGFIGVQIAESLLPLAFALCAGAMLFVISHEIIPESHRNNAERYATSGIMGGFVVMMILDKGLSMLM